MAHTNTQNYWPVSGVHPIYPSAVGKLNFDHPSKRAMELAGDLANIFPSGQAGKQHAPSSAFPYARASFTRSWCSGADAAL